MSKRHFALLSLILIAIFSRLIPHPWNWTAVGAASLFAGSRLQNLVEAIFVPLIALFISDLVLGLHGTMVFVYGAMTLISIFAFLAQEKIKGPRAIGVAALISAILFFLITNLGVWWMGEMYPLTASGLVTCYVAGLPFLATQATGDLFYSGVLFGAWALLESRVLSLQKV